MKNKKIVAVVSGGMDSVTLLYDLVMHGGNVFALSFDYGQRHKIELDYAKKVCEKLGVPHKIIDITSINCLLQGSSLTSGDIATPHGHYAEESMKKTVVPNRNMIMLSIATGYAVSIEAEILAIGVHSGDHFIYKDCRPEFIDSMQEAIANANDHLIMIFTPYLYLSKADICAKGMRFGINYNDETYTCYEGRHIPCGVCGACNERNEAVVEAMGRYKNEPN